MRAERDALDDLRWLKRRRRGAGLALVAATLAGVALVAACAGAGLMFARMPDRVLTCDLGAERTRIAGGNTALVASDGTMLGFVPTALNREPVPLERMSWWLPLATVSIEDRRFWEHGALDPVGIARSALADVTSQHVVQGASTLTQQLVRARYLDGRDMTLARKLNEACLAAQLFRRMSRKEILEAYLNSVFYGHHSRGVQAAAWTYFSRSAARLTLEQAALLAGLPQAPSHDDPLVHPTAARARRDAVLAALYRDGHLSAAGYRRARAAPLRLRPGSRYRGIRSEPFFAAARAELDRRLGHGRVRHGALRVTTTLDFALQRAAQRAIGNWISAPGEPAAALVAIDPRPGAVRALATRAPGVSHLRFGLATQSHRQAGSAFKVFTLASALEHGIRLRSVWQGPPSLTVADPRCLNADGPWQVHNFADETAGTMDLIGGIAHSVNTIFAQVAVRVGPESIVDVAHRMGIRSPLRPVCSITLGPEGVSPLEMTDAFATLAAGGVHHAPEFLRRVTDGHGQPVTVRRAHATRALAPWVADRVTYALSAVIHGGTGTAADPGRPAAGKTGTAENSADAWFCGYVPQLAACVWVGHPQAETPMTALDGFSPVVGGSVPARIWHDFMVAALAGRRVVDMPQASAGTVRAPAAPTPPATAPPIATTPTPATRH
jgi:penicillin-binding protein 1A